MLNRRTHGRSADQLNTISLGRNYQPYGNFSRGRGRRGNRGAGRQPERGPRFGANSEEIAELIRRIVAEGNLTLVV